MTRRSCLISARTVSRTASRCPSGSPDVRADAQHPPGDHAGYLTSDEHGRLRPSGAPAEPPRVQPIADPKTLKPVPADGRTVGEVMLLGNTVMLGYLKDTKATDAAFRRGWFHTGDLAVQHPDGYIEIKDRLKDIIISGGENISSIEVEIALTRHPAVLIAAVVARPDEKWGETPCAFVQLKDGAKATADELIAFCREQLPRFAVPKTVVFGPLPTTATGKIQKYTLREQARVL
jgi:3-(methylthio)propionyl---CoA ligase